MNTAIKIIQELYPDSTNHKIYECYKPTNDCWVRPFGVNLVDLTINTLVKLESEGYTIITVYLKNEWDKEIKTDYNIKELLSLKNINVVHNNRKYTIKCNYIKTNSNYNLSINVYQRNTLIGGSIIKSTDTKEQIKTFGISLIESYLNSNDLVL